MELWYTEKQTPSAGITCKVKETLCALTTPYQELAVLETEQYGRMLVLDGMVQTTEADEFVYHEMIAHVPLCTHPNPRRVGVIGGGDGGTIREVLKHPAVERAVLVEIDEQVVASAKRFLPELSGALDDPRTEVRIEDGIEHVRRAKAEYDVLLIDSTEPVGAAVGLFSAAFYRDCHAALAEDGILVAQTESPFFNRELVRNSFAAMRESFPLTRLYLASVPTYPSGLWSFTLGSKRYDPLAAEPPQTGVGEGGATAGGRRPRARGEAAAAPVPFPTRYYTPSLHRASFQLPRFVGELVAQ